MEWHVGDLVFRIQAWRDTPAWLDHPEMCLKGILLVYRNK